jgi:hypothetical protein
VLGGDVGMLSEGERGSDVGEKQGRLEEGASRFFDWLNLGRAEIYTDAPHLSLVLGDFCQCGVLEVNLRDESFFARGVATVCLTIAST